MKLLSVAIPSYNAQDYMEHAIESLLPAGEAIEILIINDGSTDRTPQIADNYQQRYPNIVHAIHKENGGHGDAVMAGLRAATGLYFKVVDSDDWVDTSSLLKVLEALQAHSLPHEQIDLLVCNYIYDKAGASHKHVVRYGNALPENRVLSWQDVKRFHLGQYLLMHSVIYRTQMLKDCGLSLPKHTFYVDELYVYAPLPYTNRLMYLDLDLYHYYIGRSDQSVQEDVMIRRIDQQIRVNRLMLEQVDVLRVEPRTRRRYMFGYLTIITTVSSILLLKSGTPEHLAKKEALWADMREHYPDIYRKMRRSLLGIGLHLPGKIGRNVALLCYRISHRIFGFN